MHFTLYGRPASEEDLQGIMDGYTRHGIFSIRDMGHKSAIGLKAVRLTRGRVKVSTAGYALFRTGGYGAFLGKAVTGKEEIQSALKEIADAGADFIKVINSGIVTSGAPPQVTPGGFSPEELRIICEEAGMRNLQVSCHANSDKAIRDAVMAGVTSVEHGFFVSRETLRIMAEKGVAWTPTACALLSITPTLRFNEKHSIEEVIAGHLSSIYHAASLGLRLRIGTDSGSLTVQHGDSFFDELRLFERAGLTLDQILSASCMNEKDVISGNFLIVKKDFISTRKIERICSGS